MRCSLHSARERADVRRDHLAVLRAQVVGNHGHPLAGLEVDEVRRVGERELDLGPVEQVEDDQVVAAPAHVRERLEHGVGFLVEVGDQQDDAPAAQRLGELAQRLLERGRARRRARCAFRRWPRSGRCARARAARGAGVSPMAARTRRCPCRTSPARHDRAACSRTRRAPPRASSRTRACSRFPHPSVAPR